MRGVYEFHRNDGTMYIDLRDIRTVRDRVEDTKHWVEIDYADKSQRIFPCDTGEEAENHARWIAEELSNCFPVYPYPLLPRRFVDVSTQGQWEKG